MRTEEIQSLFEEYEQAACDVNQVECWSARDLQKLLGYTQWRNFVHVIDKANDLAAEMTSVNVQTKDLQGETAISKEHIDNNAAIRQMLVQRGIIPENLPPAEDVKKVEVRKILSGNQRLTNTLCLKAELDAGECYFIK